MKAGISLQLILLLLLACPLLADQQPAGQRDSASGNGEAAEQV